MTTPNDLLKSAFGFDSFRAGQLETIDILLARRSAAAIFPTGSGKSLCYQLTALLLPGLTLVVSPLLALMKDQIDSLQARGIAAERLDSSLSEEEYRAVSNAIRAGELKMLFVSPERLTNERFLNLIRGKQISLLAVDEAHCISAWGHNFRPDYLKLAQAVKSLGVERVLALTATATPRVSDDMAAAFGIAPDDVINTGFYRPNLEYRVSPCGDDRNALLLQRLRERPAGATIVYVHLQKDAENTANFLCENGFDAAPYHAGLKSETRAATQEKFMAGELPIICATIAFGMGVDKSDIRYIYHYHLPKGFESYMQETGRAGRDGRPAVCELFAHAGDRTTLENFVYGDTPDAANIAALVDELLGAGDEIDVTARELSTAHDIRQLVVSTLLTHLELFGVIAFDGYYYSDIRFEAHQTGAEILAAYPEKQAAFLRKLFACGKKARKWITLDMDAAIQRGGQPREVVLRAFESLQEKGFITLQMSGYRQRFKRLKTEVDRDGLVAELEELFLRHERMEIERIDAMVAYAGEADCLTNRLLTYFGEPIDPCGHCGVCLGDAPAKLPPRKAPPIDGSVLEAVAALAQQHPEALGQPRQQARFLCGLNSPAVSKQRDLRGHPLFGRCANVPFKVLLEQL